MDKSFNYWREPLNGSDNSESDSEIIESSKSNNLILAEDSDEELDPVKVVSLPNEDIIPPSDEDEHDASSNLSSASSKISTSKNTSNNKSHSINTPKNESKTSISNRRPSILEQPVSAMRKNKGRPIIYSDSEEEVSQAEHKKNQINEVRGNKNKENIDSKNTQIYFDSTTEDEDSPSKNANILSNDDIKNNIVKLHATKDNKPEFDSSLSPYEDAFFSSTKLGGDDSFLSNKSDISSIDTNKYDFHESHHHEITNSNNSGVNRRKSDVIPTVDLTLPFKNINEKSKFQDLVKGGKRDDDIGKDAVVIIDSDSEEEKQNESNLINTLSTLKISPSRERPSTSKLLPAANTVKNSENDVMSRIDSLKAEEAKLNMQVSNVLRDIETTKTTLKTANLSALPDKGVRLQMHLKKLESQLRDLRYQQSTLANQIIKEQVMSQNVRDQPKQQFGQKMFKLPTTTTDLNAMGKKAMETHRTQQALTVDALRTLHNSLKNCPDENTLADDPRGLLVELMPHQKHALAWLLWREREKPSGGILADDMGLGKTLTLISLILKSNENRENVEEESDDSDEDEDEKKSDWLTAARKKLIPGQTLVVCPASLIGQWEGEVQKRVRRGTLDVTVHHGSNREKKARRLAKADMVVTTYSIVSRDATLTESPLFQIRWGRVILDEAHQIRNYKTKTAEGVFKLKAKSRWALTGTPIHNKEIDLFALIKFLRCSPFDDLLVWKRWVDNRDVAGTQRLTTITKSLMLRRTKQGLQEKGELTLLTEKKYNMIFTTLDKEEQSAYEKLLIFSKKLFSDFLCQKAEKENIAGGIRLPSKPTQYLKNAEDPFKEHPDLQRLHRQMNEISDVKSTDILVVLLRLRQFCCHPALIKAMLDKEDVANGGIEDNEGLDIDMIDKLTRLSLNLEERPRDDGIDEASTTLLSNNNPLFAEERLSSKMRKVVETLENILKTNEKVVVVSQWVSLLNVVQGVLKERKVKYVMLTGSVAVKDRAELVDSFNKKDHGPKVMLLTLTAGGVGLNLVGGNHLLLLDLHWNPQLENQACDRIYRVGQEKNVQIYKFISSDTIEEKILKLQEKKLEVADDIFKGVKHTTNKLSLDDLKLLFQITK